MIKLTRKKTIIFLIIFCAIIIVYYIYSNYFELFIGKDNFMDSMEDKKENTEENLVSKEESKEAFIIIHISGAVKKDGIVQLKEGSRVADAIEKAEGLNDNACIKDVNLAEILEDGVKIYIPTVEEYNENKEEKSVSNNYNKIETKNETINEKRNIKVNINTATQSELETLPGIGASIALKIITYRKENGKFKNIEDIKNVSGIGESKYKNIKDLINI